MNLSRFIQEGLLGLWRKKRSHNTYAIGAAPRGKPGWPDFAFSTASTAKKRIVLMHSSSIFFIIIPQILQTC